MIACSIPRPRVFFVYSLACSVNAFSRFDEVFDVLVHSVSCGAIRVSDLYCFVITLQELHALPFEIGLISPLDAYH